MTLTTIKKAGLDEIALDHVFTIGASGTDHYTFQGEGLNGTVNDPTLYLTRGKTYRFENGTGAHAIRIQSADNGTNGTLYNTGVTNNNTTGTVIVEVQHDAPDVLYYQCASHANMKGTIYITGALADNGVTTAKIADDAVTTAKIADNAIVASSINATSVTTAKVADGAITDVKLATNSVATSKIPDGAVTTAKLASNSVTSAQISANSIVTAAIQDEAVTLAKLPHGTSSNDGKFLRANNGGDPTFESLPSSGATLSGSTNNTVVTVTGSNAMQGESNLTYDGNHLTVRSGTHDGGLQVVAANNNQTTRIKIQGKHSGGTERNWFIEVPRGSDILNFFDDSHGSHTQLIDNGNLSIVDGNLTLASGHGIDFSATANTSASNATMQNELLADYEKGEWYPVIKYYNNGTWSLASMTSQGTRTGCSYVKIGNMCFFHLGWDNFEVSNSSYAVIGGLPFDSNGRGAVLVTYTNMFTNHQDQGGHISGSTEQMEFYRDSNNWNGIQNNQSGRYIYADGFYQCS